MKFKKINGPMNVIRLEGKIFGINKVLYLFLDKHFQVQQQTKCQEYLSEDVVVYLNREFHKIKDKNIDFFIETWNEDKRIISDDIYRDRYIDEVIKFFYKYINKKDGKTIGTKISNNIRFHYIDPRKYIKNNIYKYIDRLEQLNSILTSTIKQRKPEYSIKISLKNIKKGIKNITKLIDLIQSSIDKKSDANSDEFSKLINKIANKYNHPELKKSMIELLYIFIDELNIMKDKLIKLDKNLNSLLTIIKNDIKTENLDNLLTESKNLLNDLYYHNIEIFCWLIDIYFIRRILDKDYITHGVVYTGGAHSLYYIYFLVKNFDFKITHAAKIEGDVKLDKINSELKVNKKINVNYLWNLFLPNDDILQCSDLSEFPENFD
jgi:hypothetical protein